MKQKSSLVLDNKFYIVLVILYVSKYNNYAGWWIMKENTPYKLNKQDEKIVHIFTELGMPKNLAKTLTYISQVDECRSADVEQGANLRQPEVSVAMQELRNRGWAEVQSYKKKKGKGRPIHIYKATIPLSKVMVEIEQQKTKEIEDVKNNMSELKNIFNNR